jgi:hypothetical protein
MIKMNYYNLNGIKGNEPGAGHVVSEWSDQFSITDGDNTTEIDFKLIDLTHCVASRLFGTVQNFYAILPGISMVYPYAGVDAEIKVSKNQFEKFVNSVKSDESHKVLFYYDLQNLVGSLQNLVQESRFLFCDFYKTLNHNSYMLTDRPMQPDILMFASGQLVTGLFSKVNHLFINLSSQLDFITKIAFEMENLPVTFTEYPKLKSNGILYSDYKKIKSLPFDGTLFEANVEIKLINSLRNEIIHNASFENNPKVYQVFRENRMIEKYILVPDHTNGVFETFKNRKRFFHNEIKLNEILPAVVANFWKKMENTVDKIGNANPDKRTNGDVRSV